MSAPTPPPGRRRSIRLLRWGLSVTGARLHHYAPTLFLGVFGGLLDAAAMALLIPLADAMATGGLSSGYPGWQWLTDGLRELSVARSFLLLLGIVFGLLILRTFVGYLAVNLSFRRDTLFSARMQSALLAAICRSVSPSSTPKAGVTSSA